MKLMLEELLDEKVLLEGCKACIKNPSYLSNVNIHNKDYKKLLIKPRIAITILILSFVSANVAIGLTSDDYSILYILSSLIYFIILSFPFFHKIKTVNKWYELTNELYNLMYNKKDLYIDFGDFKLNLFAGESVLRSIYYYDLANIEFRKNIIIFMAKKRKNSFFISSKYKDELMPLLKEMDLMPLVKEKIEWK